MNLYFKSALARSGICNLPKGKSFSFANDPEASFLRRIENLELNSLDPQELEIRFDSSSKLVSFAGASLRKPLIRFDFLNEWNNLGYGAIPLSGMWGIGGPLCAQNANVIATLNNKKTGDYICDYLAVVERDNESILWMNREVGLIDGYDWNIVERFLSEHRFGELGCHPVIDEIPWGFSGAVTMRIDCDEAISSGRPLFELFDRATMPFSMAIKTQQSIAAADIRLIDDVIKCGGSVVGHSHTHAPDWGGGGDETKFEVGQSRAILKSLGVDGIEYDYAVSPFHQNSMKSVAALKECGIKGFVAGIIHNDPEFLFGRAGQVPLVDGIISHSQQCMFHGDTFHEDPSLAVYNQALKQAFDTRTFFGYLDHPFSSYQYGWLTEDERLEVHSRFLSEIKKYDNLWKPNLADAMKFLWRRSKIEIFEKDGSWLVHSPEESVLEPNQSFCIRYGGSLKKVDRSQEVQV